MSSEPIQLSPRLARRLAITRQRLAGTPPEPNEDGVMEIMRAIRCLQLDPIDVVARSPLLVLWSRLGNYDTEILPRLLWQERCLFEYWAHAASIVLTEDYPIFRHHMQHYLDGGWRARTKKWLLENQDLRQHILDCLASGGPLAPPEFNWEATAADWHSSGWTDGRTLSQMLQCLWTEGTVMVAGRRNRTRLWDLPERCLPPAVLEESLSRQEAVARAAELSLRALGVATERHIRQHFTRNDYPGLKKVLAGLKKAGRIVPVQIVEDGTAWPGDWFIHRDDVALLERLHDGEWQPRTTFLSPFDNLICDRQRTEQLFDFYYRIEIYVPVAKREYGYYVLPLLHGDCFIGRMDAKVDRSNKRLDVKALYAEPGVEVGEETGRALAGTLARLATFVTAQQIAYSNNVPSRWRPYLPARPDEVAPGTEGR